ncbi:conserved hypothetical protein [Vibrio diabolicus]|nr:conserved hypothetical protein [Vibrio diabolicus]
MMRSGGFDREETRFRNGLRLLRKSKRWNYRWIGVSYLSSKIININYAYSSTFRK